MNVIDFYTDSWFLFEFDGKKIFSVNCSSGFYGVQFAIELSESEFLQHELGGSSYLNSFANEIFDIVLSSSYSNSIYEQRNAHSKYSEMIANAILKWKSSSI